MIFVGKLNIGNTSVLSEIKCRKMPIDTKFSVNVLIELL